VRLEVAFSSTVLTRKAVDAVLRMWFSVVFQVREAEEVKSKHWLCRIIICIANRRHNIFGDSTGLQQKLVDSGLSETK